jgi:hypothetical protein
MRKKHESSSRQQSVIFNCDASITPGWRMLLCIERSLSCSELTQKKSTIECMPTPLVKSGQKPASKFSVGTVFNQIKNMGDGDKLKTFSLIF